MSKELGVGTPVWVGFTDKAGMAEKPYMCRPGVIVEGPNWVETGVYRLPSGRIWAVDRSANYWRVSIDGARLWAEESLLFPIDDGDEEVTHEHDEAVTA